MHSREELSREAAEESRRRETQHGPGETKEPFLELQRASGNAAVARLLQRVPRDRPASTDAPGHSGSGHGGAKEAPAKAAADIHARIIKVDIDDGQSVITIASGPDQGVQVGMSGSLLSSSGKELVDFTIESAEGRVSKAHVRAIPDEINQNPEVVIKPSSLESQEGKGF